MIRSLLVILAFGPVVTLPAAGPDRARKVDYLRQIKPILAARCWGCHGALKQAAGLRLDASQLIRKGSDEGPVLVAGQTAKSLLWAKITSRDATERMPPEGDPLTKEQLELIRRWITSGASAPQTEVPPVDPRRHWSFLPARRPTVPPTGSSDWGRNAIDAFIAAGHAREGLTPQPAAARAVLLRRVYLDLIGVPPTRQQLKRFLADTTPGTYERTVDALLENPLHGQRWGRHWMDVWRYSDWYGRRPSNEIRYSQRHIWRWRDWIIESINAGKGYDRMLTEMLAGDELAPGDDDTLRATGFLGRNWYKFDRNTWLFETVEKTSKGLLALTFRCARCHDHKFDPVSQEEYYRFRAFFEPHGFRTDVLTADVKKEVDNGKSKVLSDGLARVFDERPDVPTYLFVRGDDRNPDKSRPLAPGVPAALGGNTPKIMPVDLPAVAYTPQLRPAEAARLIKAETGKVTTATTALEKARGQIATLEKQLASLGENPQDGGSNTVALSDSFDQLNPKTWKIVSGTWKAAGGVLTESAVQGFATIVSTSEHPRNFRVRLKYRTLPAGNPRSVGFSFDYVDGGQSQDVYTAINPNGNTPSFQAFHRTGGKQVYPQAGTRQAPELKINEDAILEVTVIDRSLTAAVNGRIALEYTLPIPRRTGKFALWVHKGNASFDELTIHAIRATKKGLQKSLVAAKAELPVRQAAIDLARARLASIRARLIAEQSRLSSSGQTRPPRDLALAASRAERWIAVAEAQLALLKLATTDVKARKKAHTAVQVATSHFEAADGTYTAFKATYPTTSTGRRTALAHWLTQPKNPRTARVAVNQIWMRHIGESFVTTESDFGIRSQPRTHPALMDWLAVELIESGWDMKHLHRLIVTSEIYRMSSTPGPAGNANLARDPANRLLWRMHSRRMEAELVRDSVLAVTGALDPAFGGPDLDDKLGQTSRRRSLYFRTTPDNKMPFLELFDLANPNECYRRRESVVPQQALALTNSPLVLEHARQLARSLSVRLSGKLNSPSPKHPDNFVIAAFEVVLNRRPTPRESAACQAFLVRNAKLLADTKPLKAFPAGSGTKATPSADPAARARENLVHILFSHNDFVTIR